MITKLKTTFTKTKAALSSEKAAHVASKIEKSSHFIYFGAAAMGAHDLYSAAAGVIVVIVTLAYFLHLHLEG